MKDFIAESLLCLFVMAGWSTFCFKIGMRYRELKPRANITDAPVISEIENLNGVILTLPNIVRKSHSIGIQEEIDLN